MGGINDPAFDDVRDEISNLSGIFGGDGYQAQQNVSTKMAPSGYVYTFRCQGCNCSLSVLVTWDEFLFVMARKKPVDSSTGKEWIYDPNRGGVYPPAVHSACETPVPLLITAQEAAQRVDSGMQARKLSPQYVQNAMQKLGQPPLPPRVPRQR